MKKNSSTKGKIQPFLRALARTKFVHMKDMSIHYIPPSKQNHE